MKSLNDNAVYIEAITNQSAEESNWNEEYDTTLILKPTVIDAFEKSQIEFKTFDTITEGQEIDFVKSDDSILSANLSNITTAQDVTYYKEILDINGNMSEITILNLQDSNTMVAFVDENNYGYGTFSILNAEYEPLTINKTFSGGRISNIKLVELSTDNIMIFYKDFETSKNQAIVINKQGQFISNIITLADGNYDYTITPLSNNNIQLTYIKDTDNKPYFIIIDIDGTEVVSETQFLSSEFSTTDLTYAAAGSTITTAGAIDFTTYGLVDGVTFTISGSTSNNGTYTVNGTPTATVLTVNETLVNEGSANASGTFTVELLSTAGIINTIDDGTKVNHVYGGNTFHYPEKLSDAVLFSATDSLTDAYTRYCLSVDGTKLFTIAYPNTINRYDLDTSWDLNSINMLSKTTKVLTASYVYSRITISHDGEYIFLTSNNYGANDTTFSFARYSLGTAYDLSTMNDKADYIDTSLISNHDTTWSHIDIQFSADGNYLYKLYGATNESNNSLNIYELPEPYSLSTIYKNENTVTLTDLDLAAHNSFVFNSDGTKIVIVNNATDDTLYQYTLTTAYDLTSLNIGSKTLVDILVAEDNINQTQITNIQYHPDGSKIYILANFSGSNDTLYEYTLTVADDITQGFTKTNELDVSTVVNNANNVFSFTFNSDGSILLLATSDRELFKCELSVSYDISTTAAYHSLVDTVFSSYGQLYDIFIDPTDSYIFISFSDDTIRRFNIDISTTLSVSNATYFNVTEAVEGSSLSQHYFIFKPDGTEYFTTWGSEDILGYSLNGTPWLTVNDTMVNKGSKVVNTSNCFGTYIAITNTEIYTTILDPYFGGSEEKLQFKYENTNNTIAGSTQIDYTNKDYYVKYINNGKLYTSVLDTYSYDPTFFIEADTETFFTSYDYTGGVITEPVSIGTNITNHISMTDVSTGFFLTYENSLDNDNGYFKVISDTGTEVAAELEFENSTIEHIQTIGLSNDTVLILYKDINNTGLATYTIYTASGQVVKFPTVIGNITNAIDVSLKEINGYIFFSYIVGSDTYYFITDLEGNKVNSDVLFNNNSAQNIQVEEVNGDTNISFVDNTGSGKIIKALYGTHYITNISDIAIGEIPAQILSNNTVDVSICLQDAPERILSQDLAVTVSGETNTEAIIEGTNVNLYDLLRVGDALELDTVERTINSISTDTNLGILDFQDTNGTVDLSTTFVDSRIFNISSTGEHMVFIDEANENRISSLKFNIPYELDNIIDTSSAFSYYNKVLSALPDDYSSSTYDITAPTMSPDGLYLFDGVGYRYTWPAGAWDYLNMVTWDSRVYDPVGQAAAVPPSLDGIIHFSTNNWSTATEWEYSGYKYRIYVDTVAQDLKLYTKNISTSDVFTYSWSSVITSPAADTILEGAVTSDGKQLYVRFNTGLVRHYAFPNVGQWTGITWGQNQSIQWSDLTTTLAQGLHFYNNGLNLIAVNRTAYKMTTAYNMQTVPVSQSENVQDIYIPPLLTNEYTSSNPHDVQYNTDGTKVYILDDIADCIIEFPLSTPYDIDSISYFSNIHDYNNFFTNEMSSPDKFAIGHTGDKMFVMDGKDIFEYTIGIAWDLESTITYTTVTKNIDTVSALTISPTGIRFNGNGTKLFISDNGNVYEFSMSAAYDLSTLTYDQLLNTTINASHLAMSSDDQNMFLLEVSNKVHKFYRDASAVRDITLSTYDDIKFDVAINPAYSQMKWNNDGTRFYLVNNGDNIYQYDVGVPYSLSSVTAAGSKSMSGITTNGTGLEHNNDGTKFYILEQGLAVKELTLSTPWDITTATSIGVSKTINTNTANATDICFRRDGKTMFILNWNDAIIYQYNLTIAWNITTAVYNQLRDLGAEMVGTLDRITGMHISNDETKVYISYLGIKQFSITDISDISTLSYDSKNYSVHGGLGSGYEGFTMNADESKFYQLADTDESIRQYDTNSYNNNKIKVTFDSITPVPTDIIIPDRSIKLTEESKTIDENNNVVVQYTDLTEVGRSFQRKIEAPTAGTEVLEPMITKIRKEY